MSIPVFLGAADAAVGATVRLTGAEGHHAVRVRRLGVGERLAITDGAGRRLECKVLGAEGADLVAEVMATEVVPPPQPSITVVQALPKGERAELAVALLTEVGVDRIVPWQAARCIVQWRAERADRGRQRWAAAAREAAKQSRRIWHPEVTAVIDTAGVADLCRRSAASVVLHEAATSPLTQLALPMAGELLLVVGPEGGIADEESAVLSAAGAELVRMGPEVMRTSTAGAVAAAVLASRTARWAIPS